MHELALFAGSGCGLLGSKLLGWQTAGAVEINEFRRRDLMARQDDGSLDIFPIWDDVRTFDGFSWRGLVDVITGGFPCVGISSARQNGINGKVAGLADPDSGLWREEARIIREVEPRHVLVENSPNLTVRGLSLILGDLASMGFNAKWGVFSAESLGAPHERERLWIKATNPNRPQCERGSLSSGIHQENPDAWCCSWWNNKPGVYGVDDGTPDRVDRLAAIGNGQVPAMVRLAWETLT